MLTSLLKLRDWGCAPSLPLSKREGESPHKELNFMEGKRVDIGELDTGKQLRLAKVIESLGARKCQYN